MAFNADDPSSPRDDAFPGRNPAATAGNSLALTLAAGLAGGLAGNAVLMDLFSSAPVRTLLHEEKLQSALFAHGAQRHDIAVAVGGLVALSLLHGWLFEIMRNAIPGRSWLSKGLFWGFAIWALYWVVQEWFVHNVVLGNPTWLDLVELAILLLGSLTEGVVIALILARERPRA